MIEGSVNKMIFFIFIHETEQIELRQGRSGSETKFKSVRSIDGKTSDLQKLQMTFYFHS